MLGHFAQLNPRGNLIYCGGYIDPRSLTEMHMHPFNIVSMKTLGIPGNAVNRLWYY